MTIPGTTRVQLDTNVIIRFLTGEPAEQATAARRLLASGTPLHITHVTIAECAHVLRSVYRTPQPVIATVLRSLLALPHLDTDEPDLLLHTLEILETTGLGFADAHLAATAIDRGLRVASFDRGLDRIAGLAYHTP